MIARKLFKAVSIVFAPQVSPIYFFTALLYATKSMSYALLGVTVIFASIVPMLSLFVYARLIGSDAFVSERSKRYPLFYTTTVSYVIGFVVLRYINAPFIIAALMLSYAFSPVLAAFINKRVNKVSIHVWGISGPALAVLYVFGVFAFFLTIAAAALVGLCRIGMGSHTPEEVEIAIAVPVLLTYLIIFLVPIVLPGIA